MAGDATAVEELRRLLAKRIGPFILKAGADRQEMEILLADLLHDLLVGKPGRAPMLRQFTGQCVLVTWLTRVATNRWIDSRRIANDASTLPVEIAEVTGPIQLPPTVHPDEEPLVSLLRRAISNAMHRRSPEEFVMFRLGSSEGLRDTELAEIFHCDRKTIARRIHHVTEQIRQEILAELRARVPRLRLAWEDVVELCRAAATDVIPAD